MELLASRPDMSIREIAREVGMPESTLRGLKKGHDSQKMSLDSLPIPSIRLDGGTQVRVKPDEEKVAEYAESLESIMVRYPLVVFFDGTDYWLSDGFHRIKAAMSLGWKEVSCDVRPGSKRDALRFALSANAEHGIPRTNADKRNAVAIVLTDAEWRSLSDAEIGRMCEVSPPLVASVREELASTQNILIPATRTTANGRQINTANLGRKPKPAEDRGGQKDEDEDGDDARQPGSDDDLGEPVTIEVNGDPAPDPDLAYLSSIPLRARLAERCLATFDRDALAFRKATRHIDAIKAAGIVSTKTGEPLGAWQFLMSRAVRASAPHDWLPCTSCMGGHDDAASCSTCHGRGYVLP
jgi:hypothetical protein